MKDFIEKLERIEDLIAQANGRIKVQENMNRAFPTVLRDRRDNRIDTLNRSIKRLTERRERVIKELYVKYITKTELG